MESNIELQIRALIELVEQVYGKAVWSPTDFDHLSAQIKEKTNERLGVSTLKRMWGYVKSKHIPTFNTLSTVSRFVGYRDWDSFKQYLEAGADSDFTKGSTIVCADESLNEEFLVEWGSGKVCRFKKIQHPALFEVVDSCRIKLKPGDTFTLNTISEGEKFVALACRRGDEFLGNYIGAITNGVLRIMRIERE